MKTMKVREKDLLLATKTIRNFNSKVNRTIKKMYSNNQEDEIRFLPDKEDMRQFKKDMKQMTRKQFNERIYQMQKFSVRGAEKIINIGKYGTVRTTRWENANNYSRSNEETQRRKQIKKDNNLSEDTMTLQNKADAQYLGKKVYNPKSFRSQKEYDLYRKNVLKTTDVNYTNKLQIQYKKNYVKAINNQLGNDGEILAKLIASLPVKVVNDAYWSDDPLLNINYTSDPVPVKEIAYSSLVHWLDYLDEHKIPYDKSIVKDFDRYDLPFTNDIWVYDEDGDYLDEDF